MFDMLTADELWRLHTSLYDQGTAVYHRMLGPDVLPLISVYSDEWAILAAWHAEISEMQQEISAELRRRAQETVGAPANADGSDHERPMPDA